MERDFYCDILCELKIGYAYQKIVSNKNNLTFDFQLLECNKLFEELTGLEHDELICDTMSDNTANTKNNKIIHIYKQIISKKLTKDYNTKIKHLNKDLFIKICFKDDGHFFTIVYDITEKTSRIKKVIADICGKIKTTVLIIDPESGDITFANDEACNFYGYSYDKIVYMNLFDFTFEPYFIGEIPPEHFNISSITKESVKQSIELAVNTGRSSAYFQQKDSFGRLKDVIIHFTFAEIFNDNILFAAVQDKTVMMSIWKKLRENEQYYRILFEDAPISYQTLDEEGKFIKVNKEWEKMLGYKEHEVMGKWFGDFITDKYVSQYINSFEKCRQKGSCEMTCHMRKKDGGEIPVSITARVRSDKDGEFIQCHCILEDITSIIETQKKEHELNKTKNEFLAIISHELRTPLTTILGLNQLLLNTDLNNHQLDYINKISNAGRSLLGIINDMLDVTKYESGKMKIENLPFAFDRFASNIITINKMRAEKSCNSFEYEFDENIPQYLIGDDLRIGQVINNLLGNAFKFTNNGKVNLSVRLSGRTKDYADIQILVRDTGIGMTQEQVKKLFIPFEQADSSFARKYGGSGLGMVISKQLIDLMGGNISVESIFGEGSIFIIDLTMPIDKIPHRNIQLSPSSEQKKAHLSNIQGKKILVVEDHPLNRKILYDILKFYKLDIDTANNGLEAINKTKENNYDLIFMDIQMPEMDGLSATKRIRSMDDESKRNIPILAMTAHAMKEEYIKSMDAGMNGHMIKPIDVKALEKNLLRYLIGIEINPDKSPSRKDIDVNNESEPIDIRIGLHRFNNDADAYKSSLNEFLSYKKADKRLLKMLKNHCIEEALKYLHSIKGLAGNLSINKLSRAADELRNFLLNQPNTFDESNIAPFSHNLKVAIEAIECKAVFNRIDSIMAKHAEY